MATITTLRPGLLVSLSTSVKGNVSYRTTDIESEHLTDEGAKQAKWETLKRVDNPEEHEEAIKVRSKCRRLVTACCAASSFGLLCRADNETKLHEAVNEAQALASEFNARATITRVHVYVIIGRVAEDDVQAVRAINSEVRDLLAAMETGIRNMEPQAIRDAANKARAIGSMLSPDAAARVQAAIETARASARRIVKAAEEGQATVDQAAIRKITQSRTAFLDIEASEPAEVAAPETIGRAIDLEPIYVSGNELVDCAVKIPVPAFDL